MDANNLQGIRYALQNKFGLRIVTHPQVVVVSALIRRPGMSTAFLEKNVGPIPASTFYRTLKVLRYNGIVDKYNKVTFRDSDMVPKTNGERVAYPLVSFIKERMMPPSDYVWSHLAAYIATQTDPVGICEALTKVIDPTEQLEMLYEMQNGLAFCSIMAGDVSQWADMKGEIQVSDSSKFLLKKAGKKIK